MGCVISIIDSERCRMRIADYRMWIVKVEHPNVDRWVVNCGRSMECGMLSVNCGVPNHGMSHNYASILL